MKAVIMAGGEGTRLRPLTCDKPKPMVPVMNRPLMDYSVELLRAHGFRDIAVTLQYLPDQIKEHYGDGRSYDVNLHYYIEDEPLGTAGSVRNASAFLDETFLVVSGDALTDFDLSAAVDFHRARGAMATLVLTSVENPLEYGVVMIGPDGRIQRFLEKPGWGEVFSDTVNTGIYILEPEVLSLVEPGKMVDFSKDIFPRLLEQGEPLFGCVLDGFWCDIGDLREYLRAHREVLEGRVHVRLNGKQLQAGIWAEDDVFIHPRAQLQGPVYLGQGCSVEAGARVVDGSVLGSKTRVEDRASVKRGLTWTGVYIGRGAALRGGILCNAVQLGTRSSVFEGAVVGDGSVIQDGAVVKPGVKVWPAKNVESGVVLQESLIWGGKASRTIFGHNGICGEINRNITPEMAVRLGAAYGSMLQGGSVLVSDDRDNPSRMLSEAFISGLLSTGSYVLDGGELLIPMARRAVVYLKAQGGLHISRSTGAADNGVMVRICFFDQAGLPFSRSQKRKLEQLYFREDFYRPPGGAVGQALRLPSLVELYRRELLQKISEEAIARAGFRLILGNPSPYQREFLIPLLQQLQCTVITINNGLFMPPLAPGSPEQLIGQDRYKEMSAAVRNNSASLGAIIEPGGEQVLLFDERGKMVRGDLYTALLSLLIFRARSGGTVAVPVNVSHVVEALAERYQGRVLRTKLSPRDLMETMQREERSATILYYDGVAALVYLLDFLAVHDLTLSELLKEIPAIRVKEREIPCPWTRKGKVMRRLIQETTEKKEMIDGLKVYHPQGWALIMPDPEKPSYHVFSEGYSEEIADSLTEMYVEKIHSLQRDS